MRVGINAEERYPDYDFEPVSSRDFGVEVDDTTLDRWRAVIGTYNAVQREMEEASKKQKEGEPC